MRFRTGIFASCVLTLVLCGCESLPENGAAGEASNAPPPPLITKYQTATIAQQKVLRGVQMQVDIDAKLTKLEKTGKFRGLRSISKLGSITYKMLGFSGDNTIKKEVIARYLQSDADSHDNALPAITPANYKFREKAVLENAGRKTYIFAIKPRKKQVGLFEGELWLDAETGMPVREAGRFVKNPSVFLKTVDFVRDYEIRDGISYPKTIQSTADVRVFGKAELNISFSNYTKADASDEEQVPIAHIQ